MGLDNAERQARWRANAEIERLRKAAAEQAEQLAEARREIEIAILELAEAPRPGPPSPQHHRPSLVARIRALLRRMRRRRFASAWRPAAWSWIMSTRRSTG